MAQTAIIDPYDGGYDASLYQETITGTLTPNYAANSRLTSHGGGVSSQRLSTIQTYDFDAAGSYIGFDHLQSGRQIYLQVNTAADFTGDGYQVNMNGVPPYCIFYSVEGGSTTYRTEGNANAASTSFKLQHEGGGTWRLYEFYSGGWNTLGNAVNAVAIDESALYGGCTHWSDGTTNIETDTLTLFVTVADTGSAIAPISQIYRRLLQG